MVSNTQKSQYTVINFILCFEPIKKSVLTTKSSLCFIKETRIVRNRAKKIKIFINF